MFLENESELKPNKRDVLKANFKGISEEMGKVDWEKNLNWLEVNEAYSCFLSVYEKIWNEYVPLKRNCNGRKGKGTMSQETKGMVRQKHKLWYRIRSEKDKLEYRDQCSKLTKSIKEEKLRLERELAS